MRTIRHIAIAGTTLAGVSLFGCGDDAEALTKPELIEQADAICQAANDQILPIFEVAWAQTDELDFDDPADRDRGFRMYNDALVDVFPIWSDMADDLRALHPPDEDEALIDQLLDDLDSGIDEMQTVLNAAAEGDEEARQRMDSETDDPFADVNRRARQYGMTVCGSES